MAKIAAILCAISLVGCTKHEIETAKSLPCEPLSQLNLEYVSSDDQRSLLEASEDFCAVLAGKPAIHARLDGGFQTPPNGSTKRYVGRGYTLLSIRDARLVGGVMVGVAGPILQLDSRLAPGPGNPVSISQVRLVRLPTMR